MTRAEKVACAWIFFAGISFIIFIVNGITTHSVLQSVLEFFILAGLSLLCIIPVFGLGLAVLGQLYFDVAGITGLVIVGYSFVMLVPFFVYSYVSLKSILHVLRAMQIIA